MSKSFDTNTPIDYNSINQDNDNGFQKSNPSYNNLIEVNKACFCESKTSTKNSKNTKVGRKRIIENIKEKHNKFSDGILRRKCKYIILKYVRIFINVTHFNFNSQ